MSVFMMQAREHFFCSNSRLRSIMVGKRFFKDLIFPEPQEAAKKNVSKLMIVSLVYLSLVLDNILLTVVGKYSMKIQKSREIMCPSFCDN